MTFVSEFNKIREFVCFSTNAHIPHLDEHELSLISNYKIPYLYRNVVFHKMVNPDLIFVGVKDESIIFSFK